MSQFHYGSIKTQITNLIYNAVVIMSQFHYGSIKTTTNPVGNNLNPCSLNSTMVRLKRGHTVGILAAGRVSIPLWFD